MKKIILLLLISFLLSAKSLNPLLQSPHIVQKRSKNSYYTTIKKLKYIIKKKGFKIIAAIDHTKMAKSVKVRIDPAYLIIFGNPKVGAKLMKLDVRAGLDLPMRILVFRLKGKTYISYHKPIELLRYYHLQKRLLLQMDKVLDQISDYARK
ncbi:DUF302 domain-containing protein [Nitratiruptor sp. YY09-18]|uniref:DUF302 domain-containing protein n=1 Tax=Nitratiruptor sp. YY09-18 TaxID=2724901 RepID=UPI00191508C3|nr:DUF302 domain-containing protein [Nitratiruptor sp. YY09-18]BCD67303.1 hypothetical protein NitYY0918_C0179 [Nitratiruptor sp. YY09-18]